MDFDFTDDQRRTQQAARHFAERVLAPRAADVDRQGQLNAETREELGTAGWLGMTIPEALGGSGGDVTSAVLAIEELAAACANSASFVGANILAARTIRAFGSEAQRSTLVSGLGRGNTSMVVASFDPEQLPADGLEARRRDDGSYELHGRANVAGLFGAFVHAIVFARTDDVWTAFVVPYAAPNLYVTVLPASFGKRAANLGTLSFDGVVVSEAAILGVTGAGLDVARSLLADARILAAAEAIGVARGAYERAVLHIKGLPKSTEPGLLGTQVLIADMCVEIEAARLLTLRAARQAENEVVSGAERSIAKLFATEMASRVVHKAMQIVGVRNVLATPSLERNQRDARVGELSEDGLDTQRAVIARTMLKA